MSWLVSKVKEIFSSFTGWSSNSEFDYSGILEKIRNAYFYKTSKGSLQVRQIVNYLSAAIMGTGCNVKASKETAAWLQAWKKEVSFESKLLDYGRFGQLEGQILIKIDVVENSANKEKQISFHLLPYYKYRYSIMYDQFGNVESAKYPVGGGKFHEILKEEFAYVNYSANSGMYSPDSETTFPIIAFCMENIEIIEDCKKNWKKLNDIFAKPTPVWETEDDGELSRLTRILKGKSVSGESGKKWENGDGVVTKKAKLTFAQASLEGINSIKDLIVACYEENSFITGIPIYLIKPEVFSNRATAEETQDGINQATITDRIKTERLIEDLLSKVAAKENQLNAKSLEPNSITVSLPPNSLAQMKSLATTLSTLVRDQALTPETLWDLIPEVDSDIEMARWQKWFGQKQDQGGSDFIRNMLESDGQATKEETTTDKKAKSQEPVI